MLKLWKMTRLICVKSLSHVGPTQRHITELHLFVTSLIIFVQLLAAVKFSTHHLCVDHMEIPLNRLGVAPHSLFIVRVHRMPQLWECRNPGELES